MGPVENERVRSRDGRRSVRSRVPYESRWAPCVRTHEPGQGQLPVEIDKAPGIMLLTHPAAPPANVSARHASSAPPGMIEIVANRFAAAWQHHASSRALTAGGAAGIEHLGHLLDALGGGVERRSDRRLGGLGALGRGRRARPAAPASSSSRRRSLPPVSASSSATVKRRHDGEPRVADLAERAAQPARCADRARAASRNRWLSWPSSQAMRNWRPLMVTVTCDMVRSTGRMDHINCRWPRARSGWSRWRHRAAAQPPGWWFRAPAPAPSAASSSAAKRERSAPSACN